MVRLRVYAATKGFWTQALPVTFLAVLPFGCIPKAPGPSAPRAHKTPEPPRDPVLSNLLGVWTAAEKEANRSTLLFEPSGRLVFEGLSDGYNPAQWTLDENSKELRIALPGASNQKLDIFKMYVGDGVKAFDRAKKEVTYSFDAATASLNVAGWLYRKEAPVTAAPAPEAEPVLK